MADTGIVSDDSRMSPYDEGVRARAAWLTRTDGMDEDRARRYAAYRYRDSVFGRDGWVAALEEFLAGWDSSRPSASASKSDGPTYYRATVRRRWRYCLMVVMSIVILAVLVMVF